METAQLVSSAIDLAGQVQPTFCKSPMLHFGIVRPDERGLGEVLNLL